MVDRLVVKCTWGADAPERANQALTVAATAAASGVAVSLWLTGEGSWLATPDAEDLALDGASPSTELLDSVLTLGTVTVCAQCAGRRGLTEASLLPGVRIAGSASFVEEALDDSARVIVY